MPKKLADATVTQLDRDIQEFYLDRQARNLSKNSLRWYTQGLTHLRNYFVNLGITDTRQIEATHIRRWLVALQNENRNEGGVYSIFGAVRTFFRWYATEQSVSNPLQNVDAPKRITPPQDVLSLDNFKKLLDTCKPGQGNANRDKAILYTLLDTGIRHDEISNLTVGDIDFQSGAVTIRKGKGRKFRTVYVGSRTRKALSAYMRKRQGTKPADPLWIKPDGKRLSKDGLRQMIARRSVSAGIQEPGLHEFRRAFAVGFLRNGGNVLTLQRLLGHTNIAMTEKYVQLVNDDLQASTARHGVVDNLK